MGTNAFVVGIAFNVASCSAVTLNVSGNNAVEMQTTATFDQSRDEFVISTPTTLAQVRLHICLAYCPHVSGSVD